MFSHKNETKAHHDEGLISILKTETLRNDLISLLDNCMYSMQVAIADGFDAHNTAKSTEQSTGQIRNLSAENSSTTMHGSDINNETKKSNEKNDSQTDLTIDSMRELRIAALEYFRGWKDDVWKRVREALTLTKPITGGLDIPVATSPPSDKIGAPEDSELQALYPPHKTLLAGLDKSERVIVLHYLLLLLLSQEHYCAHSRILMLHLTSSMNLSVHVLSEHENETAKGLLKAVKAISADQETKKRVDEHASSRKWKVGLASVAGAAVIGLTGGLAAPLLAAGIGSVMGGLGLGATAAAGYLGTLASSSLIVGGLFGAYGAKMTGEMMDQYAKEVDDFGFMPIRIFHESKKTEEEFRRLRVAIGISGWLTEKADVVTPWRVVGPTIEGFALRWELETLLTLGNAITTMIQSYAWGYAKSEIIKRTIFASLRAGLWPLSLLKVSRIVDNPFSVAKSRSDKAGQVLADALINKVQGERPVTLIGYSLGARLIYSCLLSLADRKAFGLIETVVLIGTPAPTDAAYWTKIRAVVSGRVVNVFSTNDHILGFLYRTSSIQYGVAGLQGVEGVKGVQNVDVSDLVSGHTRYRHLIGMILNKVGLEDMDMDEIDREIATLRVEEEYETKTIHPEEQKHVMDASQEAEEMEKEIAKKTQNGMAVPLK